MVQAGDKPAYTLPGAIDLAQRQNPEVLQARQQIELARGRKLQAYALTPWRFFWPGR